MLHENQKVQLIWCKNYNRCGIFLLALCHIPNQNGFAAKNIPWILQFFIMRWDENVLPGSLCKAWVVGELAVLVGDQPSIAPLKCKIHKGIYATFWWFRVLWKICSLWTFNSLVIFLADSEEINQMALMFHAKYCISFFDLKKFRTS